MAPLQGNQFLQLDPDQKRRASSRVTDPLSHLALLDASSPKGGAFCHLPVSTDKAPPERKVDFRGSASFRKPKFPKYAIYSCKSIVFTMWILYNGDINAGFTCQKASLSESKAFQFNQERGILL